MQLFLWYKQNYRTIGFMILGSDSPLYPYVQVHVQHTVGPQHIVIGSE